MNEKIYDIILGLLLTAILIVSITLLYFRESFTSEKHLITQEDISNLLGTSTEEPLNGTEAYVISLSDKLYYTALTKINYTVCPVEIKMFDAIRGSDLKDLVKIYTTPRAQVDIFINSTRSAHADLGTLNAIGCYMSHMTLWYNLVQKKLKGMYIFESDVNCINKLEPKYMEEFLNSDGDILLIGSISNYKGNSPFSMTKLKKRFYGTQSYYISYSGAKKALKHALPIDEQVDSYLSDLVLLGSLNVYVINPSVCIQTNKEGTSIQLKKVVPDRFIT